MALRIPRHEKNETAPEFRSRQIAAETGTYLVAESVNFAVFALDQQLIAGNHRLTE